MPGTIARKETSAAALIGVEIDLPKVDASELNSADFKEVNK